jgi:hypothetical protein
MASDPRVKAVGEIKTAHLFDIVIDPIPDGMPAMVARSPVSVRRCRRII